MIAIVTYGSETYEKETKKIYELCLFMATWDEVCVKYPNRNDENIVKFTKSHRIG